MSYLEETINTNPFVNPEIVSGYEDWYLTAGKEADNKEKALIKWLLTGFPGANSILEVGCGTGHFTRWFGELGLRAVGLDLSQPMLQEAKRLESLLCLQGDALTLPFLAGSFDLVAMITTLEFLPEPVEAMAEALRICRQGIILGVLNEKSHLGQEYKRQGGPIWGMAHFYTPDRLKRMVRDVAGENARVFWRTTLWPLWPGSLPLPCGGFIGMAVKIE